MARKMILPIAAFCAGLALAWLAWCGTAEAQSGELDLVQLLCVNEYPARRSADVTYGGLLPRHGYQRDHWRSLGLGGPDTKDNVHYQRCDLTGPHGRCESGPAALKDADEHEAEEKMCSRRWSPDYAQQWLAQRWPIDAAHGYDAQ